MQDAYVRMRLAFRPLFCCLCRRENETRMKHFSFDRRTKIIVMNRPTWEKNQSLICGHAIIVRASNNLYIYYVYII